MRLKHFQFFFLTQDYESVYRCGDFSDSESDIEEHNRCFNFNTQNLFKRKHSDDDATDKEGKVGGESDVTPSKRFKSWFRKKPVSDVESRNPGDDFDPTYGFAQQLENRTYFRNKNVDTSIPMDYLGVDQYQDILYPLRTSTGSTDSSASGHQKNGNGQQRPTENDNSCAHTPNANIFLPSVTPTRKRVQFDERSNKVNVFRRHPQYHHNQQQRTKGSGYLFNNPPDNGKLTLRQRITNFFSNLF